VAVLGFTGTSRALPATSRDRIDGDLATLVERHKPTGIVTGACVGVDAYVHHWFADHFPEVRRTVVFPGNLKATDPSVADTAHEVQRMPAGSSYRARNTRMVELSDTMASFWTGQERSGTYMTMNIARRAQKLESKDIFGVGLSDSEVRNRYLELQPTR